LSEEKNLNRLRELVRTKTGSFEKIKTDVTELVESLHYCIQKDYSVNPEGFKGKLRKNFKSNFFHWILKGEKYKEFEKCLPNKSVFSKFLSRTNTPKLPGRDTLSLYFGYAGWIGFCNDVSIKEFFDIDDSKEKKFFNNIYLKIYPSNETIAFLKQFPVDNIDETDQTKKVIKRSRSDEKIEENIISEKEIETLKKSQNNLEEAIKKTQQSINNLKIFFEENNSKHSENIEKDKRLLSQKLTDLKNKSESNFKILEQNKKYLGEDFLIQHKKIKNELKKTTSYYNDLKTDIDIKLEKIKNEILENEYKSSKKVFKIIHRFKRVFIFSVFTGLIFFFLFYTPCGSKVLDKIDCYFTNFQSTNPNSCKILILPFNGLDQCKEKPAKYEEVLEMRYRDLRIKYNFDIEIISLESVDPPKDEEEVRKIGEEKKADIIIWGDYAEYCKGNSDISVKYIALRDINKEEAFIKGRDKFYGDSGVQPLTSIYQLKKGYLQKDIDYVVFWSCFKSAWNDESDKKFELFIDAIEDNNFIDTRLYLAVARTLYQYDLEDDYFTELFYNWALKMEINYEEDVTLLSFDKAMEYSNLKENEVLVEIWRELIYIMEIEQRYSDGIKYTKQIIKQLPEEKWAWLALGKFQYKTNDLVGAEKSFLKSIEIDSNDIESLDFLYHIMKETGRLDESIKVSKKILKIDPLYYGGWSNLGLILLELNKYTEAKQAFSKALEIKPKSFKILYNLGYVFLRNNELKQALIYFNRALKVKPNNYQTLTHKGLTLHGLEKIQEANNNYNKAIELDPNKADAYLLSSCLYLSEGEFFKSFKRLMKVLNGIDDRSLRAKFLLGKLILSAGNLKTDKAKRFMRYLNKYLKIEGYHGDNLDYISKARKILEMIKLNSKSITMILNNPQRRLTCEFCILPEKTNTPEDKSEERIFLYGNF